LQVDQKFRQAEIKMISYVETNASKCGIPPQISDQLKNGHKNTEENADASLHRGATTAAKRAGRPKPE